VKNRPVARCSCDRDRACRARHCLIVRDAHGGKAYAQTFRSDEMNTLSTMRLAVACAAACCAGFAWADSQSDQQPASPQASQDVGGTPSSMSAAGAPTPLTHEQVYQDLIRAEKSGQLEELKKTLYNGG
jgi:hypothetical protein